MGIYRNQGSLGRVVNIVRLPRLDALAKDIMGKAGSGMKDSEVLLLGVL